MIQIYYGDGKGKTTAAIGAGIRAKGAGKEVLMVQFLKDNQSSELKVLPFRVFEAPDSLPFHPGDEYEPWIEAAYKAIIEAEENVIILDEFLDVIPHFISIDDANWIIRALSNDEEKEVIITGHQVIDSIFKSADYITRLTKEKHPYDNGVSARKGFEY